MISLDKKNPDAFYDDLEKKILDKINKTVSDLKAQADVSPHWE
jgi:hypothetical protein